MKIEYLKLQFNWFNRNLSGIYNKLFFVFSCEAFKCELLICHK